MTERMRRVNESVRQVLTRTQGEQADLLDHHYVGLAEIQSAAGDLSHAIADGLLLVDHRTRADGGAVTLCRLNRHHPLVKELTSW